MDTPVGALRTPDAVSKTACMFTAASDIVKVAEADELLLINTPPDNTFQPVKRHPLFAFAVMLTVSPF